MPLPPSGGGAFFSPPFLPYTTLRYTLGTMRVLSGITATGQLHLGNYFGSMKPNLEYVGKADQSFFFIADLHGLTTVHDRESLLQTRADIVLDYLACGFDPERALIYYQSDIPYHTELMWILACVTPMGLLERSVSYKEKIEQGLSANVGLFIYPVLMAADILLYDADIVPVGKDQKQHLEMTRDIAMKFNHTFGETLVIPEPEIQKDSAVVPGTDGRKMSKSYSNTIPIFGDESEIKKAIMSIKTDSTPEHEPKDPDTSIIFQIHKLFLGKVEVEALADEYRGGLSYGEAKKRLFETYMDTFSPMRKKRLQLEKKSDFIQSVMEEGATKAEATAKKTIERVRKAVGLSH